jgi:hypothetical protein
MAKFDPGAEKETQSDNPNNEAHANNHILKATDLPNQRFLNAPTI